MYIFVFKRKTKNNWLKISRKYEGNLSIGNSTLSVVSVVDARITSYSWPAFEKKLLSFLVR